MLRRCQFFICAPRLLRDDYAATPCLLMFMRSPRLSRRQRARHADAGAPALPRDAPYATAYYAAAFMLLRYALRYAIITLLRCCLPRDLAHKNKKVNGTLPRRYFPRSPTPLILTSPSTCAFADCSAAGRRRLLRRLRHAAAAFERRHARYADARYALRAFTPLMMLML